MKRRLRPSKSYLTTYTYWSALTRFGIHRLVRLFKGRSSRDPGFPRFQGRNRYNSFTYPQAGGFSLTHDTRVCLSKIGSIKIKLHRPLEGTPKTCTIKYEAGQWYAIFSCEVAQPEPLPPVESDVGIDLGVTHFAALSNGTFIESPRYYRRAQKKLEKLQQALSRKKRGSHECGCELDRDTNAAINILWLGRSQRGDAPRVEAHAIFAWGVVTEEGETSAGQEEETS